MVYVGVDKMYVNHAIFLGKAPGEENQRLEPFWLGNRRTVSVDLSLTDKDERKILWKNYNEIVMIVIGWAMGVGTIYQNAKNANCWSRLEFGKTWKLNWAHLPFAAINTRWVYWYCLANILTSNK